MTPEPGVADLEAALHARAQRLADEYLARAHEVREQVIRDENERLRLREEREVLAAKAAAERSLRRHVQARELKLQAGFDELRWELIQSVLQGLNERLRTIADDETRYLPILRRLLAEAAAAIDDNALVAEVNARDLARLQGHWERFAREAAPDKDIDLHPDPCTCAGGVRVRNSANRVQVDNTFEGRIERFGEDLQQVIMERLLPRPIGMGGVAHG